MIPFECPRCGSRSVEVTCLGSELTEGRFDDANSARCMDCRHKGTAGDWQRLVWLREYLTEPEEDRG